MPAPGPERLAAKRSAMTRNSVSASSGGTTDDSRPTTSNPEPRYHELRFSAVSTTGTHSVLRAGNSISLGMIPTMV